MYLEVYKIKLGKEYLTSFKFFRVLEINCEKMTWHLRILSMFWRILEKLILKTLYLSILTKKINKI